MWRVNCNRGLKYTLWAVLLILLIPLTSVMAANKTQVLFSKKKLKLRAGQEVTVHLRVKKASLVYGVELALSFDPQYLEVIDASPASAQVQVQPGNFFDSQQAFFLKNKVDNQSGTIDYIMTLLNPAPPVKGAGKLFTLRFKAKKKGKTKVRIIKAKFGTKTGAGITPAKLKNLKVVIKKKKK